MCIISRKKNSVVRRNPLALQIMVLDRCLISKFDNHHGHVRALGKAASIGQLRRWFLIEQCVQSSIRIYSIPVNWGNLKPRSCKLHYRAARWLFVGRQLESVRNRTNIWINSASTCLEQSTWQGARLIFMGESTFW